MIKPPLAYAALALVSGVLFAFAFPPAALVLPGFLALVCFAFCVQRASSAKAAFWTGYAFGAGQFLVNFFWIANAFSVREGFSYAQGLAAVIALALAVAFYPALASFIAHRLARASASRVYHSLAFALCWFIAEWLRGLLFTGFPWNPVGAMWGAVLPVAQVAGVLGVYGLSAVTVLSAALVAAALPAASMARRFGFAGAGAALIGLSALYGWTVIPRGPAAAFDGIELVLVQANIAQEDKWNRALLAQHLRSHISLSQPSPLKPGVTRIIIWPETAYPYLIEDYANSQRDLQRALGADQTLIFGANRFVGAGAQRSARNAMFILQDAALIARYDKVHLVPFGEYVPFAWLLKRFGVETLVDALSSFSQGPGTLVMAAPGVPPFAPMICYEGIFSRHLFGLAARPKWILNISNDAWFGQSSGPAQHLNLVRFRAIEQGLSVVRSTGTGISAVLDPYGQQAASLPPFTLGSLTSELPKGLEKQPFFAFLGRWFAPFFVTSWIVFMLIWRRIAKI